MKQRQNATAAVVCIIGLLAVLLVLDNARRTPTVDTGELTQQKHFRTQREKREQRYVPEPEADRTQNDGLPAADIKQERVVEDIKPTELAASDTVRLVENDAQIVGESAAHFVEESNLAGSKAVEGDSKLLSDTHPTLPVARLDSFGRVTTSMKEKVDSPLSADAGPVAQPQKRGQVVTSTDKSIGDIEALDNVKEAPGAQKVNYAKSAVEQSRNSSSPILKHVFVREKDSWDYKMHPVLKTDSGKTVMGLYDAFGAGVDQVRLMLVMTSCCMAPSNVLTELRDVQLVNDASGQRHTCEIEPNSVFNRTEMDSKIFKSEIYMSLVLSLHCDNVLYTGPIERFGLEVGSAAISGLSIHVSPRLESTTKYSSAAATIYKPGYVNRGPDFDKNKTYHDIPGNVRLPEWIAYHLSLGFEHVYVGVDGTQTEFETVLKTYSKAVQDKKVTIFRHYSGIDKPDSQRQVLGFYDYVYRHSSANWTLHCDMDEYFVVSNGTLERFIAQIPSSACSTWLQWEDFNRPARSLHKPMDSSRLVVEQSNYRKTGVPNRGFREGKSMVAHNGAVYFGLHRITRYASPECTEYSPEPGTAFLAHLRVVPRFRSIDHSRQTIDTSLSSRSTQVRKVMDEMSLIPHELPKELTFVACPLSFPLSCPRRKLRYWAGKSSLLTGLRKMVERDGSSHSARAAFFSLVVAVDEKLGIGVDGGLPWPKLARDMLAFKELTRGGVVVMGRKTYLSLPKSVRPLPDRLNIVLTRTSPPWKAREEMNLPEDVLIAGDLNSIPNLVGTNRGNVFLIGGSSVYADAISRGLVAKFFITRVQKTYPNCDVFFPIEPASDPSYKKIGHSEPVQDNDVAYFFEEYSSGTESNDASLKTESHDEIQYLDLVRRIIKCGNVKPDRTGTGTLSLFGCQMKFSLRNDAFPLLTTKRVFWRGVAEELLWFIRGSTNANELAARGVNIWEGNGSREFLDKMGFRDREVGDLGPVYGFQWRHFGAEYKNMHEDYTGRGVDQLAELITKIKTNPHDRRLILSAWNPAAIPEMALPPCHMMAQFYVSGDGPGQTGELSCQLYQRSCDMGLGVPFNIASYALLTVMIAHVCALRPGELIHTMGDAHVYRNHVEALQEQVTREPRDFPTLKIRERDGLRTIDDFVMDDFQLDGYKPHGPIKMKMAV